MSSGPSLPKLKPRSATSSCGEDTPRSSSTPSRPSRGGVPVRQVGEAAAADRDARVAAELAFGHRDRLGILVHQQQPPSGAQLFAARRAHGRRARTCHRDSVPSAFTRSPSMTCAYKHRKVARTGASAPPAVTAAGRAARRPGRHRVSVCRICAWCACSLHNSNLSPMPSSTAFFSMPTALRWLAGMLMRPLPSGSTKRGRADQLQLQLAADAAWCAAAR